MRNTDGRGLTMSEDVDITGGIKVIEWLKSELLGSVASIYRLLLKGTDVGQDALEDSVADAVILSYLLGERLGVDFSSVDKRIMDKLKIGIIESDEIEKSYGSLSSLLSYIREGRKD